VAGQRQKPLPVCLADVLANAVETAPVTCGNVPFAVPCNDNNPCTDDTCNTATGCVYTNNDANAVRRQRLHADGLVLGRRLRREQPDRLQRARPVP
jgi:hypothetical protein